MSIIQKIEELGISEILHFTRGDNLVGILQRGGILSRTLLESERAEFKLLEYVGDSAWPDRSRDAAWWGFVNLSIEAVNQTLLNRARNNHPAQKWFVLSFDPHILTHEDVYFTTTNNAYEPHVLRDRGAAGFDLPYSITYKDLKGNTHKRHRELPRSFPSSHQAEVLYPNLLSLNYLRAIYVENQEGFLHASSALHTQSFMNVTHVVSLTPIIAQEKFLAHSKQECY